MSTLGSLYTREPLAQNSRKAMTQQDLFLYEAIIGKPAAIHEPPAPIAEETPADVAPADGASLARRVWEKSVRKITAAFRAVYHCTTTASEKRTQTATWLRHLSDQAIRRIDQAQARITASRAQARRRVEAREVMSVQPMFDEHEHQVADYKRAA